MRKCIVITILTLWSCAAFAQGETSRTLTVVGSASTQVLANNVDWVLSVTVKDKVQEELRSQADEILLQVKEAADRLGINPDNFVIDKVTINKRYKNKKGRVTGKFSHYELSQRITIIQKDIQLYDGYWNELTAIEGVRVNQKFYASDLEPTRRQLRIDALEAAKQKAEDLASIAGGSVGIVLSISEFKPNPNRYDNNNNVSALRTSIKSNGRLEKINMSARVYAIFELE